MLSKERVGMPKLSTGTRENYCSCLQALSSNADVGKRKLFLSFRWYNFSVGDHGRYYKHGPLNQFLIVSWDVLSTVLVAWAKATKIQNHVQALYNKSMPQTIQARIGIPQNEPFATQRCGVQFMDLIIVVSKVIKHSCVGFRTACTPKLDAALWLHVRAVLRPVWISWKPFMGFLAHPVYLDEYKLEAFYGVSCSSSLSG